MTDHLEPPQDATADGPVGARRRPRGAAGPADDTAVRLALVQAAERQLVASGEGDIVTRAVCEEAGVTQPVLYRIFGDKRGLLDAVAEAGLQRYARRKHELEETDDPVADLHTGWADHMAFAAEHPALYQLMFTPRPHSTPAAYQRVLALLEATLVRCAAAGALRLPPHLASQLILPANVGMALSLIAQPGLFTDPTLSERARDAVFAAVLAPPAGAAPTQTAAADSASAGPGPTDSASAHPGPTDPVSAHPGPADPVPATARQLRSQLALTGTTALEPTEAALLDRWLERLDQPR